MSYSKKINALISTIMVLIMCVSALAFAPTEAKAAGETFIIDVGHGGEDPGALGPGGREEADDVLRLAMKVGEYLAPYTSFVYTRTTDATLSLSQRSSMANAGGYDYIISIHRNAFSNTAANGLETWWYSGTYGGNPSACQRFATYVYDAVMEQCPAWTRRGVKDGNLHMCRQPYMPSCLIETGFITNVRDNEIFDQYFDQNAFGIAKGMLKMIGITPEAGAVETWQEKACFDVMVYRDRYPDLAGMTDAQLKDHWLNHGIKEGRASSPVLDLGFYLNNNPDLQEEFGTDYEKVYEHFITKGYKEKRKSSALFDGKYYTEHYPEAAAKGDDYMKYYVEHGILAGHRASLTFDPDYYWFINPPVWEAWPAHYQMCARHYAGHGVRDQIVAYDNQLPVISNVIISDISADGYKVTCTVTDNWEVSFVSFPTWTIANDQDDLAADFFNTQRGTKDGDTYTFYVKASDHNNEGGLYATHIYAQDKGGNLVSVAPEAIEVKDGSQDVTPDTPVTPDKPDDKLSEIILGADSSYEKDGNVVGQVSATTTVNDFLKQFENENLVVKDASGNELSETSFVGTGATASLYDGETLVDQIFVVVLGDVDGNGVIDGTDYLRVKSKFLGVMSLDSYQNIAADVDGNGVIDGTDYIRIKGQFLGTFEL